MCNNWALDKSSVKCHLIRMHAREWYRVAEAAADACKAHKHLFVRDTECKLCLKKVYGVERHALQCPVLFQACFMHCLAKAPSERPDLWLRLRDITVDTCKMFLNGTLQASQEEAEALSRFCLLCARRNDETPVMDVQAWRRHLQQAHSVSKEVLTGKFHEHVAPVSISRPCTFCRMPFQKSPSLLRSKCLPLAQLISIQHGYDGVGGGANIAGLWGLSTPTGSTASTPEAPIAPKALRMVEAKAKPAKFRKQEKGGGKGQVGGRKRQEHPEEDEAGDQILVSRSELNTIRTLLVRHDQALNQLAVDRTYVLFFTTTDMSTVSMLRTVTNHWREQYTNGACTSTLRATLLTSLWLELEARLNKFEADPAAIKVMADQGLFMEAPSRWAYTAWNPQEKKSMLTDQPHLSSDELKAAIQTPKAAAITEGVIHKFAPMQKLGENISAQAVVFTLVMSTRGTEMTKLINSAATSLIGLRLRPERLQLSLLAKALAGPRT